MFKFKQRSISQVIWINVKGSIQSAKFTSNFKL